MASIRVLAGEAYRFEVALVEGAEYSAGSAPDCAIVIEDPRVSARHCEFTQVDGRWVVEDRDSALGTFVNGERIAARRLEPGDRIAVGTYTLLFGEARASVQATPRRELTLESIDAPAEEAKPDSEADADLDPQTGRKAKPMVLVLERPRRKAVPLERQVTLIGKGRHCDLRIGGWFVRDEQAVVVKDRGCCRIICKGGLRPVRVNGDTVREILLQAGDVITIGGNRILFQTY